jgi:hypothetical protein
MTRVAYIKDVQPSGTEGQTATTGSFAQMRLNTLEGDTSFVSLSSNRFTLQPGSYTIDATAEAYGTGVAKIALIKDPGGSPSTEIIGSSSYTDNSTVAVTVKLNGKIEIDSATTFELRARAANATRFGVASSFGVDEVYTQVKITRLMD